MALSSFMTQPRLDKSPTGKLSQDRSFTPALRSDSRFISVFLCLCGLLGVALPAYADFARNEWQFSKPVESSTSSDGYLRVSIDGEVYRRSQRSLADLRLVDGQEKEVPYSIHSQRETTTEESYEPKIFNRALLPGAYSTLTLDLAQEAESNTLVLKTSSRNFKRLVEIAGSNDRKQWFVLKSDGYIFDFSGDQKVHLTTIKYPDSKYRYLQVKVWNGKEEPLAIEGASLSRVKTTPARRAVRGVRLHSREEEAKLKATICVLDLRYENLPADFLTIDTPEENFSRMVEIQASNDLKGWESFQQGDLYRFRTDKYSVEKKALRFPEMRCRYLKLVVYNHDDPPLKLAAFEVQGVEEDLVCRAQPDRYLLYYGNRQAHAPRYDFERLKNYLSLDTIPRVRLGVESENGSYRPSGPKRPWTETQPVLFWSVLILMVFGLGAYIVRLMMKVKAA
jgi:Protein of unknown function (DUF3999)